MHPVRANASSQDKGITCFPYHDLERASGHVLSLSLSFSREALLCASRPRKHPLLNLYRGLPPEGFLLPRASYLARTQKGVIDPDEATPRTIRSVFFILAH